MDNVIIINNKEYNLEKIYRQYKNDTSKDANDKLYPYPKEGNIMPNKDNFLERLNNLNKILENKKKFYNYSKKYDCLLCGKKDVSSRRYYHNRVMWEDSLYHYVDKHNVDINVMFKDYLFTLNLNALIDNINRDITNKSNTIVLNKIRKNNKQYVKIDTRQLLILDALMIHGGITKKYSDNKAKDRKYSEHAGILDFENNTVKKIIVAGNTHRVDEGDDEIFLPMSFDDMLEYEYIFHTHPPTPKPGGRAKGGILYEYPSISDIFHFIDHHNDGVVIGSIVIAPEGLYNIRKNKNDKKNIDIDEDALLIKYQKIVKKNQKEAIKKYSTNFSENTFYSKISQDRKYIENINSLLNTFNLQIDFYPRIKSENDQWIIETVYLVFRDNSD